MGMFRKIPLLRYLLSDYENLSIDGFSIKKLLLATLGKKICSGLYFCKLLEFVDMSNFGVLHC